MAATLTTVLVPLPRPLTSLIGREQELQHLYDLLQTDAALVTITGFGGMGKTRLSLQVALELEPLFQAGAIFVPLAAVTNASSIPKAIAITAGLDESVDSVESLAEALGPFTRLLVLDNLEQIPDAAQTVLQLIQTMPDVSILATSRTRLELGGEYVLSLEPLATESSDPRSLPAVQLFIERGKSLVPTLPTDDDAISVIAEICQKLEGIPLAIELTAARLAIFSLPALRDQLQNLLPLLAGNRADMPDRQRTMRNAIRWTYDLLEDSEKRLFIWLSVYEQDFSLDSIRHIAHNLELTDDPIDLVQFLVSRNLVRPGRRDSATPRFQMPQMLREFGHEQLLQTNEDMLARRSHGMHMAHLAEEAEPLLTTRDQGQISQQLTEDLPNLFAALQWSSSQNQPEIGQRIIGALWRYFESAGHPGRVLELAPDVREGVANDASRARALIGIGYLNERLRNLAPSLEAFTQAVEVASTLPDQETHVSALVGLGIVQFDYSEVSLAQETLRKAGDLARSIGYQRGQLVSEGQLSVIDLQLGNFEQAIATNTRLRQMLQESGDLVSAATLHINDGVCYINLKRAEEAQHSFLSALELCEQAGDKFGASLCYANLTGNSIRLGNLDDALAYGEKGLELARELGIRHSEATLLTNLAGIHFDQRDFSAAMVMIAQAAKIMDFDGGAKEQVHMASVTGEIAIEMHLHAEAAEMVGAAIAMREELQLGNAEARDVADADALEKLDPDNNPEYAAALERGAALDRSALVNRIQEIGRKMVAIQPPKSEISAAPDAKPSYDLTPRETEVLKMVAQGLTNSEIAEEMFVSVRTITTHISNIFGKLEVNNRSRAIATATQAGLV